MSVFRFVCSALTLSVVLPACRDGIGPEDELTRILESEHYTYRMSPGDQVDTLWQETYHDWLTAELGITARRKIEFYKYRDRSQLKRLTGEDTNGFAEPAAYRIHTIWPFDNHEVVHTVAVDRWGSTPALFSEGFAVAHQTVPLRNIYEPHWSGTAVHDLARQYLADDRIPALDQLLESTGFRRFDPEITYPLAGSFVRYLIDTDGLDRVVEFISRSGSDDRADATRANFQAAFGQEVEEAWGRWLTFLE